MVNDVNKDVNDIAQEKKPDATPVSNATKPEITKATKVENTGWVKENGKMTTSLSPSVQAVMRELAPSNVSNITQFITWLLEDYTKLGVENHSLQVNQDLLNAELLKAHELNDKLDDKIAELGNELHELNKKPPTPSKTPIAPAPTEPIKEKTFLELIGFG